MSGRSDLGDDIEREERGYPREVHRPEDVIFGTGYVLTRDQVKHVQQLLVDVILHVQVLLA